MNIERDFDVIYNSISVAFLVALAAAVVRGGLLTRRSSTSADRRHGGGAALAAFGTAVALAGGLVADGALQDSAWFQQVRFGIYYVGFALVVWGTSKLIRAAVSEQSGFRRVLPAALAGIFVAALIVSVPFLAIPSTFVLNARHEQVQLVIYWLPLLVATAGGGSFLLVAALRSPAPARTRWLAVFELLLFLGLLREAEIVPDLGDPLVNLAVSFVPFLLGGIAAAVGAGMRARGEGSSAPR